MAKTVAPGMIEVDGVGQFHASALPDPFDARDLEYRPRLQPLQATMDNRDGRHVMRQDGQSCTGHALAAVINTVLANGHRVSPYMLYRLARRYDEFAGDSDVGSSLRGAFKGWFHHGVLPESSWPSLTSTEPDLDSDEVMEQARDLPLGAYYRVDPYRLDDMQSAIAELGAICVSAVIHQGWERPAEVHRNGTTMRVIARPLDARSLGGHAFAVVGYNEVGFLVQNSWGTDWGDGGFATLPYDDWLESAYDAWVARPGVPQTPFADGRSRTARATGGRLVTGPAPDLRRLAMHVVNLGNGGRLSTTGRFTSSPEQLDRMFEHMDRWHRFWIDRGRSDTRHVVLYAHGGLNSEAHALSVAQENVNWWLNNTVYPVFFAWQSGVSETFLDHLADAVRPHLPFGFGFDLVERLDRRVELIARRSLRWMWDEMKENARAASDPTHGGAAMVVARLRDYIARHGGNVRVHLVGHSAGAIFHAAAMRPIADADIPVASMALLAPALRLDEFARDVLPHLRSGRVRSFSTFNLSDRLELDDACGAGAVDIYHKSILYLVSRALEGSNADTEVPLLGMQKFLRGTSEQSITATGGSVLVSRRDSPPDSRCNATSHGGFSSDGPTMTSVVMRALGRTDPRPENEYRSNAALLDGDGAPSPVGARPAPHMAAVNPPGERPLVESAEPATEDAAAPGQAGLRVEVASAPASGSPVIDVLEAQGWKQAGES